MMRKLSLSQWIAVAAVLGSVLYAGIQPVRSADPYSTNGKVKCTAAVNEDGTLAGGKHVVSATRLNPGQYALSFEKPCTDITAANSWSRWVQVDTLGTGSSDAYCTTADRSGDPNGVYVQCQNLLGSADTSFFIFVAK
jgi:hypothetical protein